jgi:hypothetical protein
MGTVRISETLASTHESTRRQNPEKTEQYYLLACFQNQKLHSEE